MKKELIHDPIFLAVKSDAATPDDLPTARDLIDTLTEHSDDCVGMAANMIGVRRRIIVFYDESEKTPTYTVMMNPVIIEKHGEYTAKEGCLSLLGSARRASAVVTGRSRSGIRPRNFICARKNTRDIRRRSFSTRSTIAMEY